MKMTELSFEDGRPPIDGYAPDGFRIGGRFIEGPILLHEEIAVSWSAGPAASELDHAAVTELERLAGEVDVLLIGLGREIAPLPSPFRAALEAAGLRFDAIGTPAACRTYNVLLTEDRRVAAALLPVGANA